MRTAESGNEQAGRTTTTARLLETSQTLLCTSPSSPLVLHMPAHTVLPFLMVGVMKKSWAGTGAKERDGVPHWDCEALRCIVACRGCKVCVSGGRNLSRFM